MMTGIIGSRHCIKEYSIYKSTQFNHHKAFDDILLKECLEKINRLRFKFSPYYSPNWVYDAMIALQIETDIRTGRL